MNSQQRGCIMLSNKERTKEQLVSELALLRQRVAELESVEAERRKSEEELRQSEEKYRNLFELSPIGISILDMKGVITSCNPSVYRKGGYSEGEIVGKHFSKIAPLRVTDIPKYIKIFGSIIRGKVPKPFEVAYNRKDGTTGWTEIHTALLKVTGKKLGIQVIQNDITERKQAEEEFENIFNLSPDMMGVFTTEGGLIRVNPSWETILGYKTEELLEMGWATLVHPDDVERTNKEVEKQLKGSPVVNFVNRYRCKDGSYKTLEWQATFAKEGIVYAYARDITEHRQAEEALRDSENEIRAIADNVPGLVSYLDSDGCYRFINKRYEEWFGIQSEEIIGRHFRETLGEATYEQIKDYVDEVLTGHAVSYEEALPYAFGGTRWVIARYIPDFSDDGKVKGFFALVTDISERKQAEEALQESEGKLRLMFESVTDGITVTDLNGIVIDANDRTAEIHGFSSKDELLGKSAFELIAHLDRERATANMQKTIKEESVRDIEYTLLKADGSKFIGELSASVLKDTAGNPIGFIAITRDITERKQAEEQMRVYVAGIDNANEGIAFTKMNGDMRYFNNFACRIFGYTPAEMKEINISQLSATSADEGKLEGSLREKGEFFGEIIGVRKNGETFPAILSVSIVNDDKGNPIGRMGVFSDITERKRAEEEIARLAKFPSENPNPVMRVEKDGTVLYANQAALPLLNEWRCQIGQLVPDYWHKFISEVLNSGLKKDAEVELGNSLLSLMFAPVVDAGYVNLYGLDITERKQMEEALRLSSTQWQSTFDAISDATCVINAEGRIQQCNDAMSQLTSKPISDVIGHTCCEFIHGTPKYIEGCPWVSVQNSKNRERAELLIGDKWFGITVDPILDSGHKLVGAVHVVVDITERKQAEEREEELQQELALSMRLAAVGELAAGVAHEINNPPTGVLGFSERLLRKSTDEEIRLDLERIHSEAQRMVKVMDNLRTFTRRREPEKQYSDINDILHETLELRAYELRTGNIEIVTDLAPGFPEIEVDSHQIQEVFLNIILNAEQAMTEAHGRGKLTIKTGKIKDYVRISFTDDGPGILAEHLDRLFDPFFTTRGEEGGTGLGLSICHSIVTEHGGRLCARNKPRKGATFFVELPCFQMGQKYHNDTKVSPF